MDDVAVEDDEEEQGGENDDNTDDLNKYRKRNVRGAAQKVVDDADEIKDDATNYSNVTHNFRIVTSTFFLYGIPLQIMPIKGFGRSNQTKESQYDITKSKCSSVILPSMCSLQIISPD